jgi:hypothetical protein
LRQPEPRAQTPFAPLHLARIGLMVVAGQVQQAVQNEHLQFACEGVTLLGGLAARRLHADRQIALFLVFLLVLGKIRSGEG